jgi:glutamate transport system permease protein
VSSILFDIPGPVAQRRQRLAGVGATAAVALLAAVVLYKLYQSGQFESDKWKPFTAANILRELGQGLVGTLKAAVLAIVCSVVFGGLLAAGRLSDHRLLRWPCIAFIEVFRAIPLLMLILFMSIGFGERIGTLASLVTALTLYNGSVLAEVFRSGINAVPRGQSEAAYGIGLRKNQVMRFILVPQAVKIMLPAIISQCVVVLKDTALGYIISYPELVRSGKIIALFIDANLVTFCVVAAIFITINYTLSKVAQAVEARLRRQGKPVATTSAVAGASTLG